MPEWTSQKLLYPEEEHIKFSLPKPVTKLFLARDDTSLPAIYTSKRAKKRESKANLNSILKNPCDQPTDMDEYSKCLHLSLCEGSMKPAKLSEQGYHAAKITKASTI